MDHPLNFRNKVSLIFTNIRIFHGHQTSNVTLPQRHRIQIKYYYTISNNKCYKQFMLLYPLILNKIKSRYCQCDNKRATTVKGDVQ